MIDPDPPPLVSIRTDTGVPGFRRRHGFISRNAERNASIVTGFELPEQNGNGEDLFNSSTGLDVGTEDENETEKKRRFRDYARSDGRSNVPLELGSEGNSAAFPGGVGFLFCKRFLKINWILFTSICSMSALLLLFLIFICLLNEFVVYQVGLVPSRFYKVLGERDFDGFVRTAVVSLGIIVAVALVKSMMDYTSKLLTVNWRQTLSLSLHKMYFTRMYYYQLNALDKVIDNPDQRITQDVDKFTSLYGEVLPKFVVAPFVITYYSYQAFSTAGWPGPLSCFVFFVLGSLVNRLAMLSIVKLTVQQEKCEGDFRFIHMLIRVNSESIAFQDGSRCEGAKANESLNQLISTQNKLYFRQFILNICVNLFQYLGSILSYLIVAIPIFTGVYDSLTPTDLSVVISQNSFVNMYLIFQFSQLVDLSTKVAQVIGLTHRLSQLIERLGEFNEIWKDLFPFDGEDEAKCDFSKFEYYRRVQEEVLHNADIGACVPQPIIAWELSHVFYSPPFRDDVLVADLTMNIYVGQSLLIVGSSSAGKSSLLRILRGLWPPTHGRVKRFHPPGPAGAFYCPQKPFLTVGTLREQMCFPLKPSEDDSQSRRDAMRIVNYLKLLNLKHVLDRVGGIDVPVSWSTYESLSPGEIQRLCFLRVFFHKPLLAILDEATSALPEVMETILYKECQRLGITTISVAHRESVKAYHQRLLTLESHGRWTLTNL